VNPMVITFTQVGFILILVLDVLFSYSVCSNKLRIHNVHCNPEGCRGYRIKDSQSCGSCFLRTICKFYNMIMVILNWFAFLLAAVVSSIMSFSSCVALSIVALCEISREAVDALTDQLLVLQDTIDQSPVSGWIQVSNATNSSVICAETTELSWGAAFMVGGGVCMLICQVIMLVSYFVVSEVSWRHLKDTRKEGERLEMSDPSEASRMRMAQSQRAKPAVGADYGSPAGYNNYDGPSQGQYAEAETRNALPSFSGAGGCYPPAPGQGYAPGPGAGPPPSSPGAFTHQTSFNCSGAQTSQNI